MIAQPAGTPDPDLSIAFVCPFTLIKQTGTPIRANMTIEVASRFARCHVISLGGFEGERHHEIEDVWGRRRPTGRQFRLGAFTRKAARVLGEIRPRIVHGFGPLAMLAALWFRRGQAYPRLVLELHGLLAQEVNSHWPGGVLFYRLLDRLAVRRANAIIAMSHSQREILLRRYRVSPERVTVMWGPVDLDLFEYREPPEREAFRVGYAGNDAPWQGVEDLLAAAQSFQGDGRITFRFIGIREDRFEVPAGVAMEFFANASREETARLLEDCDVLLSPRRGKVAETQYPFKLSAYLAVGRPIIATDVSDQRLILERAGCGLVVPPESPPALAGAIRQVCDLPRDERVKMGRRGRRFAEEHLSMSQFQAALARVYDSLQGKTAAAR
jgi:glycosyltransferase involved in cell wall biosynthesis